MRFTVLPKHRNLHHPISSVISRGLELLAIRPTRRRRLTLPSVVGRGVGERWRSRGRGPLPPGDVRVVRVNAWPFVLSATLIPALASLAHAAPVCGFPDNTSGAAIGADWALHHPVCLGDTLSGVAAEPAPIIDVTAPQPDAVCSAVFPSSAMTTLRGILS